MEEKKDRKEPEMQGTVYPKKIQIKPPADSKDPSPGIPDTMNKARTAMVPLFSRRSIFILAVGLLVGVLIALAYWLVSPSLSGSSSNTKSENTSTGLLGLLGMVPSGPYESQVIIQVVSPGSEYLSIAILQQRAEYYSAKALSLPFFQYLSQELSKQLPEFSANADSLGKIITTQYDILSELPFIKVKVVAPTAQEAAALAELVPQNFNSYLIAEEKDKQRKDYEGTLNEINAVKDALYKAQLELNTLKQNDILSQSPDVIFLKAKVDALQESLDNQVQQLSMQETGQAELQAEYDNTMEQMKAVSIKLDQAKRDLQALGALNNNIVPSDDASRIILDSKIKALQTELDKMMSGYTQIDGDTQTRVAGLAEMIANGNTSGPVYLNALKKVNTISQALADAKKELSNLQIQTAQNPASPSSEYQIAQMRIDTLNVQQSVLSKKLSQLYQQIVNLEGQDTQAIAQSLFTQTSVALAEAKRDLADLENQLDYDRLASDLDIKIAQDKVTNFSNRLQVLTQQLGTLVGSNIDSLVTDYLVAGNPSYPSPVLPVRAKAKDTLMMGAVAGIIIAWVLLNLKWIIRQLSSLGASDSNHDETE